MGHKFIVNDLIMTSGNLRKVRITVETFSGFKELFCGSEFDIPKKILKYRVVFWCITYDNFLELIVKRW